MQAECASASQMADVIIGKVISSMVIVWLQRSITIPNSFMVQYQECGHVAASYPSCTQLHQVLNRTFCL
jgi:hypothetical protein